MGKLMMGLCEGSGRGVEGGGGGRRLIFGRANLYDFLCLCATDRLYSLPPALLTKYAPRKNGDGRQSRVLIACSYFPPRFACRGFLCDLIGRQRVNRCTWLPLARSLETRATFWVIAVIYDSMVQP